jgi:hypothetical protein
MAIREGKTFPNEAAARAAIIAAEATWTRPTYANVGGGVHVEHASLPPQRLAEPFVLNSNRWAVIADHPSMKGEMIDDNDRPLPPQAAPQAAQAGKP